MTQIDQRSAGECECPANDVTACIRGHVYGPCESTDCRGVCEYEGKCSCPLHASPTHDSGYGDRRHAEA